MFRLNKLTGEVVEVEKADISEGDHFRWFDDREIAESWLVDSMPDKFIIEIGKEVLINASSPNLIRWVKGTYIGTCLYSDNGFYHLAKDKFGNIFRSKEVLPMGCLKGLNMIYKNPIIPDEELEKLQRVSKIETPIKIINS